MKSLTAVIVLVAAAVSTIPTARAESVDVMSTGAATIEIAPGQEGTAVAGFQCAPVCITGAVVFTEPGSNLISDLVWIPVSGGFNSQIFMATEKNGVFDSTVPISELGSTLPVLATLEETGGPQSFAQYFAGQFPIQIPIFFQSDLDAAATPLPAALPLFATGLGVMGMLGWRRKRKGAAEAAG